jgi:hypothetical protein
LDQVLDSLVQCRLRETLELNSMVRFTPHGVFPAHLTVGNGIAVQLLD